MNIEKVILGAWNGGSDTVDESEFTPWAEPGWMSWNGQSPEVDVCMFVQSLVTMMQPRLVIETGVGQGYMTRAIVPVLDDDQHLIAFESDDLWRTGMWSLPFWQDNRFVTHLSPDPSPGPDELAQADLCVLDSDWVPRFAEIELWHQHAKTGAVAVIHDTGEQHPGETIHSTMRDLIVGLGMTGFFLRNPRGCFVAVA